MANDSDFRYWLGDDDGGGFFDDGGDGGYGGDDGGDDADQDQDDQQDGDQQDDDDQADADTGGGDDGGNGDDGNGNGGDDGGDGDGDDDDAYDKFSDPDDLMQLDDDTALSADNFPNATAEDFRDDDGSWTPDDYEVSSRNLFGDHEYFGDTLSTQLGGQ